MGFTQGIITCQETRKKGFELEWMGENGLTYQTETYYGKNGFNIITKSITASVENRTPDDSVYTTALRIDAGNTIIIQLPEACNKVKPNIEADSTTTVTIRYFELLSDNMDSPVGLPLEEYSLVQTDNVTASLLGDEYEGYTHDVTKISKVEICINASGITGSTGTGGVLAANTGNLFIGGDGNFTMGNCNGITLDNLVILNDSLVAGSAKNTIQYPHPVTSGNEVANYEMDNSPNDSSSNGLDASYMGINNPRSAPGNTGVTATALTFCYGAMEVPHDTRLNINGNQFLIGVWFNSAFGCAMPNKNFLIMEKKSMGGSYRLSGSFDNTAYIESLMFELMKGYGTTNNVLQLKYSGPTKAASGANIKFVDNNWH